MEQVKGTPRKVMRIRSRLPQKHDHMPQLLADLESGKITTEEFFWHKRVCEELDKTWAESQKLGYKWLTLEEFWEGFDDV
ncbi:MAG: hypothetical protein FWD06_04350 [Oscillospiraceae bacterium]|nr:hypothetical protein [Oscillospiraceae bacterium]